MWSMRRPITCLGRSTLLRGTWSFPLRAAKESVQQGVCQYRGKWYLAYHLPYDNVAPYGDDHHRQVAVTTLDFNPDGSLREVNPDRDQGAGDAGGYFAPAGCFCATTRGR